MLFCAMDWIPDFEEHEEHLRREYDGALKRKAAGEYEFVRVIRDRRRYRAFVYVL